MENRRCSARVRRWTTHPEHSRIETEGKAEAIYSGPVIPSLTLAVSKGGERCYDARRLCGGMA